MRRLPTGLLALATAACGQGAPDAPPADARPSDARPEAAAPTPLAQAAGRSEHREFRDWRAWCDNGGSCFAFGFAPGYDPAWVRIAIEPGPDARPEVVFGFWGDDAKPPIDLVIDGRAFRAAPGDGMDESDPQIVQGVIRGEARQAIAAMAAGQSMQTRSGPATMEVSLNGASAALLWIDERQGRLNTTTALLRRGDVPAARVPTGPALPRLTAAPAIDQAGFGGQKLTPPKAVLTAPGAAECWAEATARKGWLAESTMSARLDARTELWAVPCYSGAYNISHRWYVTGPGGQNPRPAELAGANGQPDNETVNGSYDPASRAIDAFSKGRGIGDCGSSQTWIWTGQRFELAAESVMTECAGVPPDLWPTTWRTR